MDQLSARFLLSITAFPSQHINLCHKFKCEESVYPSYVLLSLFAGSENCLTSLQVGHLAAQALVATFLNQVFCLKLRLHRHHPGAAGLGIPRSLGYCSVAGGKVMGCWIDLEGLTWQASPVVSQCLVDVCCTTRLTQSHKLCSHPFPKGRSKYSKVLLLLFSLPVQTTNSFCFASVQREAVQSSGPCSHRGRGEMWGMPSTERSSFQAERVAGHCFVLEGHSPSCMLPLWRSLQIITIIIQNQVSENNTAIFAFTLVRKSCCVVRWCCHWGFHGMGGCP